jgi:hypothetical protein
MATTRTGIAMEFGSRGGLRMRDRRHGSGGYPKPGPSREFLISLVMCFPVSCMVWAGIIYSAVRLAR